MLSHLLNRHHHYPPTFLLGLCGGDVNIGAKFFGGFECIYTSVTFVLTPELTDLLTVPQNMPYKVYYYGIKVCIAENSVEDTLFIAGGTYGDLNRIIVYPRKVKGSLNG